MNDAYLQMSVEELTADPAVQALVLEQRHVEAWGAFTAGHPSFAPRLEEARRALTDLAGYLEYDRFATKGGPLDEEAGAVWARIESRIQAGDTYRTTEHIDYAERRARRPLRKPRLRRWSLVALAAAAAIAILLISFPATGTEVYSTAPGEILAVKLPDGSEVSLGPASSLEVIAYENQRLLSLTGEAFFDVERGERFTVETPQGRVAVLGTTFTINTANERLGVACATGRVAVIAAGDSVALSPGRAARVTQTGIDTFDVDVASIGGWRSGSLVFRDEPLSVVAAELTRYYDRQSSVRPVNRGRRITAELPADNFPAAIERLEFLLQGPVDTLDGGLRFN